MLCRHRAISELRSHAAPRYRRKDARKVSIESRRRCIAPVEQFKNAGTGVSAQLFLLSSILGSSLLGSLLLKVDLIRHVRDAHTGTNAKSTKHNQQPFTARFVHSCLRADLVSLLLLRSQPCYGFTSHKRAHGRWYGLRGTW